MIAWQLPILARGDPLTTIGVTKLNFCVRNGNRCSLCAIATTLFCENLVLSKLDNIFISENATFLTWLSPRPISNGPLHASRHFHFHPIYLIISEGSYFPEGNGKSHLEASFTLRCFQRLSRPYIATQRCSWRNNWYTSGMSIPVLSY